MSQPGSLAPYSLAMIVCDAVWVDPATGKRTILGTFSALGAHSFPVRQPTMAVYFSLSDHEGPARVRLRLTDVDDELELVVVEVDMNFPDRRTIIEGHFGLNNVVFPGPGEYRFQLYANGEFLIERRLMMVRVPTPPGGPE